LHSRRSCHPRGCLRSPHSTPQLFRSTIVLKAISIVVGPVTIESTADALLTKPPTRSSGAFPFYGFCRKNKEPTSGLEPLTPAPASSDQSGVAGVHRSANPPYIRSFLFSGLLRVAPYCVRSGVRVVSISPSRPQATPPRARHGCSTLRRPLRSTPRS